jgi:hypothetical protein
MIQNILITPSEHPDICKEYEYVEVKQHKDIGKTIREYRKNGWHLHTYQATASS